MTALAQSAPVPPSQAIPRVPSPGPELDALISKMQAREKRIAEGSSCKIQLSLESSPIVVLGGKFVAGEGLKPNERFDSMLKSNFKINAPVSILGGGGTTSNLILGNLPTIMTNYRPQVLVIDLAIEDLKAGFKRETTFENLRNILESADNYSTNVFVVIGPASLNVKKDSRPDNAYTALANKYGASAVLGGQVFVEDGIAFVDESTPGVVGQYKFASALAAALSNCAPKESSQQKK